MNRYEERSWTRDLSATDINIKSVGKMAGTLKWPVLTWFTKLSSCLSVFRTGTWRWQDIQWLSLTSSKKEGNQNHSPWPRNEGRAKKPELNIAGHSAALAGFGLQQKQRLVLKIQTVNQQKVLGDSKKLKSLEATSLFLKLTNADSCRCSIFAWNVVAGAEVALRQGQTHSLHSLIGAITSRCRRHVLKAKKGVGSRAETLLIFGAGD